MIRSALCLATLLLASPWLNAQPKPAADHGVQLENITGDLATIVMLGQAPEVQLRIVLPARSAKAVDAQLVLVTRDVNGREVARARQDLRLWFNPKRATSKYVRFIPEIPPEHLPGWFRLTATLEHDGTTLATLPVDLAVLPPRRDDHATTDSYFAVAAPMGTGGSGPLLSEPIASAIDKMGARWIRFFAQWRDMQETPTSPIRFDRLDRIVGVAGRYDIKLCATLGMTAGYDFAADPERAERLRKSHAKKPTRANYHGGMAPKQELWSAYVEALVKRYHNKVHAWQIWNEPNGIRSWHGDVESFARLSRTTVELIRRHDPDGLPVMAGLTGVKAGWLEQFRAAGGLQGLEVAAVHPYRYDFAPPEIGHPKASVGYGRKPLADDLAAVRLVLLKHAKGTGKPPLPLWTTEGGYNTKKGFPPPLHQAVSELDQARLLVRQMLIARASGVARCFWWRLFDTYGAGLGLLRHQSLHYQPKPAYVAYAVLQRIAGPDPTVTREEGVPPGVICYRLVDGQATWLVAWTLQDKLAWTVQAETPITVTTLTGSRRTLEPVDGRVRLELTPSPIYLPAR